MRPLTRVAMCGTFDVHNYGDLLFPVVLRHELGKRIETLEVECFSYHAKAPPGWPYRVSALSLLPDVLRSFDAVVVGGGHLIRFDKEVAPGYAPPTPDMHHPTSYWLFPALLALEANVPLIWSAVGASPELPSWGREVLREVLRASAYVSVRDPGSQGLLQELSGDREVRLVPDTVFGIRDLHRETRAVSSPYVVIQATPNLRAYGECLRGLLSWLKSQRYEAVLLPIAPVLGDDPDAFKEIVGLEAPVRQWTDPADAVTIIANAAAVVGVSLHLSITALAFGVPVLRPFEKALSKYQPLHDLPGVFSLESYAGQPERVHRAITDIVLKGPRRADEIEAYGAGLATHWNRIAAILTAPPRAPHSGLASLFQRLPFLLESVSGPTLEPKPASEPEPVAERQPFFRWRSKGS